jgi:hypothetical protein
MLHIAVYEDISPLNKIIDLYLQNLYSPFLFKRWRPNKGSNLR